MWHWRELSGNQNSWKMWILGYFYLMNRWSDLNEIWYLEGIYVWELLFQIPTGSLDIGGSWRGKSWETLGVEESGWSLVDRISKRPWYVINVTVMDSLSLGELGEGFSDLAILVLLDVLGRWKLVGVSVVRAAQIDLINSFSQIRPSGGLKGEEKL